jgi:DNA replicative helicase MCM subunit Mcm2 (Cdc46/Mcm family)
MTGKSKSMRDRLQTILGTMLELEKDTGMAEKAALEAELEEKYQISRSETNRLLSQLLREGTIYEPREGYLKKT